MPIQNLTDLLAHELRDLLNAENQMTRLMGRMADLAHHEKLAELFEEHQKETGDHIERLKQSLRAMGREATPVHCHAMAGLITEGDSLLTNISDLETRDAALVGLAQKIQHYEMAGYGTARGHAEALGHKELVKTLQKTLDEEAKFDKKLSKLAEKNANEKAMAGV